MTTLFSFTFLVFSVLQALVPSPGLASNQTGRHLVNKRDAKFEAATLYLREKELEVKAYVDRQIDALSAGVTKMIQDFWSESVESLNRLDPSILEPKVCKRGMATHRVLPYQSNVHAPYVLIQTAPQFDVPFPMVCEFITDGGGWIVIHRRTIGKLDFNREWQQYKEGFGELDGDFWLGLEKIHKLTSRWTHELRVELGYQGAVYYANYDSFYVEGEYFSYSLNIGTYSGTAGDSLRYHDHMGFSTTDQDNDDWPRGSCANQNGGGWWFANCDTSNLNGNWAQSNGNGVEWNDIHPFNSLTFAEMKIRPI